MRNHMSRRQLLGAATLGISAGTAGKLIPLRAAERSQNAAKAPEATASQRSYDPKFFKPDQYRTLRALCQAIIPADDRSGGALEACAPEFIDLLTSENEDYQRRLGGGLLWLDATCLKRYGSVYLHCSPAAQTEILGLIAYRANANKDPSLAPGINFFAFLRDLTVDGYFTSEIGIKYLRYIGNAIRSDFPGCPPVPGV